MKISVASDLHLEFYTQYNNLGLPEGFTKNDEEADVLVLAGDIVTSTSLQLDKINEFFQAVEDNYRHVVYVMGNHEHYNGDFAATPDKVRELFKDKPNIHFLDKNGVTIDNVRFFGGTMWTNFDRRNPLAMHVAGSMMNDFRAVVNSKHWDTESYDISKPRRFTTLDAFNDHEAFISALETDIAEHPGMEYCVVTHHSPTLQTLDPQYSTGMWSKLNPAYASDLENFIIAQPHIRHWCHGHIHCPAVVQIEQCTVHVNPRAYPTEIYPVGTFTQHVFDFKE